MKTLLKHMVLLNKASLNIKILITSIYLDLKAKEWLLKLMLFWNLVLLWLVKIKDKVVATHTHKVMGSNKGSFSIHLGFQASQTMASRGVARFQPNFSYWVGIMLIPLFVYIINEKRIENYPSYDFKQKKKIKKKGKYKESKIPT